MKLRKIRLLIPVFVIALVAAGCAGDAAPADEEGDAAAPEGRVIDIVMTEMAFTPDVITVSAGETVTFNVVNEGLLEHDLRFTNPERVEEYYDVGGSPEDIVLFLDPGESGSVTVHFPEDQTILTMIACLIPGHFVSGMYGEIIYDN